MTLDLQATQKKINRLARKVAALESMVEDRSRQTYYEELRRSIITAMLEVSLREDDVDNFLFQTLNLILSFEPLIIEKKGSIFLFDDNKKNLVLRAQVNLQQNQLSSILALPVNTYLTDEALSNGLIFQPFSPPPGQEPRRKDCTGPHGHYYVPIKTGSKIYGVIILYIDHDLPGNNEDLDFLTSIANICAGGLERRNYSKKILDYQQTLEQKVAAQTIELSKEKERLAVTLRSIGDGVITTDISGKVVLLNKVAEQLTGWTNGEAAGTPLQRAFWIFNEQTGKPSENPIENILRTGVISSLNHHTILRAKDGLEHRIAYSCAPIRDMESKIIGVVLVFRDITEQLKIEQELLKMKKLECIGVLAGGIAHDFNNILAAILGNINLALVDTNLNDRTRSLLQAAEKASIRSKGLTQQLLTFAKGGAPIKEVSSIKEVIQDSAQFILHGNKTACHFSFSDDLWLTDIDKGQISQVIQNIVLNASQANPDSGRIIRITGTNVDSPAKEKTPLPYGKKIVKIEISDNGPGIPADNIARIFDPFFSTKENGSGLGLAISHTIIIQHGGQVAVDSKPGKTTFTIYLPAASNKEPAKIRRQPTPPQETGASHILFMDDEEMLRNMVQDMLTLFGHKVTVTADGREAVEAFKNADPPIDLIILDLTIPGGMGGEKTVREILSIDSDAKVIVASGYSNDPIMASYEDYGFSAAVIKPFQMQELADLIGRVLARGGEA